MLLQGKKCIEVVYQKKTVVKLCHAVQVLKAGSDLFSLDDALFRVFQHADGGVEGKRHLTALCSRDDDLVTNIQFLLAYLEPSPHVHDGNDISVYVDDAEDDLRGFGQGGYLDRGDDTFQRGERQRVSLFVERKLNKVVEPVHEMSPQDEVLVLESLEQ